MIAVKVSSDPDVMAGSPVAKVPVLWRKKAGGET
jgi:hypothetical protein